MRKALFLGLFVFVFGFYLSFVSSAGIVGVSPSNIVFEEVLRGGYAEDNFLVSFDLEDPVNVEISTRGDISDWINLSLNETVVSINNPKRVGFSISPPSGTPNGLYTGFIVVKTGALVDETEEGHATSKIRGTLEMAVSVQVTDVEVSSCDARKFSALSVEEGDDLVFTTEVSNTGNVNLNPEFKIEIWNQDQTEIVKTIDHLGKMIRPTSTLLYEIREDSLGLDIDQYWVEVDAIDCLDSGFLTFDLLEEGALRANGLITSMFSIPEVEVKDTVPIFIVFKNTGQKEVTAQFKGEINRDGKIFQLLESEESLVRVGEFTNFTLYFTPDKPGTYIPKGRVFYDKKRTAESSIVVKALESGSFGGIITFLIYTAIGLLIVYLFYRISMERRRRSNFLGIR